jgi:hypothetical protein
MDVRALWIGIAALVARLRCVYRSRLVEERCLRHGLVRRSRRLLIGDQDGQLMLSECDAIAVQGQKRGDVHVKRGMAPKHRWMVAGVVPGSSHPGCQMPLSFLTIALGSWQSLQKLLNLRKTKGHAKQCSMDNS